MAPKCTPPAPTSAQGWVETARCLASVGFPEAAAEAFGEALDASMAVAASLIPSALALAHRCGDDALLVRAARAAGPIGLDPVVAGHVALSDGHPEEVPVATPFSRLAGYRLIERAIRAGDPRSALAARTHMVFNEPRDVPLVQFASRRRLQCAMFHAYVHVYFTANRLEQALGFAQVAGDEEFPGLQALELRQVALRSGETVLPLSVPVDAFVPEAWTPGATRARWDSALAHLERVVESDDVAVLVTGHGVDPAVWADAGRSWTVCVLRASLDQVAVEERRAGDGWVAALLEARRSELEDRLADATRRALGVRCARIRRALEAEPGSLLDWRTTDYGA